MVLTKYSSAGVGPFWRGGSKDKTDEEKNGDAIAVQHHPLLGCTKNDFIYIPSSVRTIVHRNKESYHTTTVHMYTGRVLR